MTTRVAVPAADDVEPGLASTLADLAVWRPAPPTRRFVVQLLSVAAAQREAFERSPRDHLPPDAAQTSDPPTLLGEQRLIDRLTSVGWSSEDAHRIAHDLDEWGARGPRRAWLDVVLRRSLTPFEALATWPLETLFSDDEVAQIIARRRVTAPVATALPVWAPGRDMEYGGHACAIVKFSRLCNLRCTYCHDWRDGPGSSMPFRVLLSVMERLFLEPFASTEVVWHGGEPTRLGRRRFLRILRLERHFARPGLTLRNRIQTNAVGLDPAWAELLATYRFGVGVSIDGPEGLHDQVRVDVVGQPTFRRVREGLRMLRSQGLLDHVYVVVGPAILELGAERLLTFLRDEGITRVGLLPLRPGAGSGAANGSFVPRGDYVRFLIDAYDARRRTPTPAISIRELDAVVRAARHQLPGHCELLGSCVGTFFSVEPDGTVVHCDKFVGDRDYVLGHVDDANFATMATGPAAERLRELDRRERDRLAGCEFVELCRGWCPYERYVATRREPEAHEGCCGLGPLFEHVMGAEP